MSRWSKFKPFIVGALIGLGVQVDHQKIHETHDDRSLEGSQTVGKFYGLNLVSYFHAATIEKNDVKGFDYKHGQFLLGVKNGVKQDKALVNNFKSTGYFPTDKK